MRKTPKPGDAIDEMDYRCGKSLIGKPINGAVLPSIGDAVEIDGARYQVADVSVRVEPHRTAALVDLMPNT